MEHPILIQYSAFLPVYEKMKEVVSKAICDNIKANGIYITAFEARIKEYGSLAGKLELKGDKYSSISDITDILGTRVITFYTDEVDKIAAMVDHLFDVDWANSVDKRKMHGLDSFGYNSLHYICRIPKSMYYDPEMPQVNEFRFEIQMRTALQHVWATINHDTGYKTGVEIPTEYMRNMNRLAGMLELADEQFSAIRTGINDYRRKVQSLVSNGAFDEVPLDGDTFSSYLKIGPFENLTKRIAAINQAEIQQVSTMPYLEVLKSLFHFNTLGDVDRFVKDNSEDAYNLAVFQIASTDLDILASTVGIQNLCIVYILKKEGGVGALKEMFDILGGKPEYNLERAKRVFETAKQLHFMNN